MNRALVATLVTLIASFLVSCGGGGAGESPIGAPVSVRFSVIWGERSRGFGGLGSALSMVLRIKDAGATSGDFLYSVNRGANATQHTSQYTSGPQARRGTFTTTATFYSEANAAGDVVGTATGQMTVLADGTLSGSINTVGTIASVQVPAGQSVAVGETKQLNFTARDGTGNLVAVTPGSVLWSVSSGPDKLAFQNGYAKGLGIGSASVSASVDGKSSPSTSVDVTANPNVSVTITPQAAVVAPNTTKQFSATVSGTTNQDVTWSVLTVGGGSISGNGLYAAPGTVMYATIEARSVLDPTKAATALVTVQSDVLTVNVNPDRATVAPNGTVQFAAVVVGSPNQNVTWSVVQAAGGSVSTSGLYMAPGSEGSFTVRATSDADPAISGSASVTVRTVRIAFANDGTGNYDIVTTTLDGGSRINLTNHSAQDLSPAISPDGSKIAFVSNRSGASASNHVYVMNADGSGVYQVTNGTYYEYHPCWSPDGQYIVYAKYDGSDLEIARIRADGSGEVMLTDNVVEDDSPAYSPDGSLIAFERSVVGGSEIFVMDADGSRPTNLTNRNSGVGSYRNEEPAWSPDGQKIAFAGESSGHRHIWTMNSDGSNQVQLTTGPNGTEGQHPCFSPDGQWIVYSLRIAGNEYDIWKMRSDGSGQVAVTADQPSDREPSVG